MNQLDRLEALAQRLIEGTFSRFFQTPLVDKEPDKAAETKEALVLGVHRTASRWILQLDGHQVKLGEPVLTIGRALDNDIVIDDPTVSRYHAQLRWREGRYHLYPPAATLPEQEKHPPGGQTRPTKLSSPHTTVNRRPVVQCPLQPGDVITLGQTTAKVMLDQVDP